MLALASCLFFFYYRAGRFSNTYAELKDTMELRNEKTERLDSAVWYLNEWKMYHTLYFEKENIVLIDNHPDTAFHYKYRLDKNTLWLLINKADSIPNKIKLHNNRELVFESFLDSKKGLRYTRASNRQK